MERFHPNFVNTDFTWIWTSAIFLELIGLGQIRKALKTQVSDILPAEWKNFASEEEIKSEAFCDHIAARIKKFISEHLSSRRVYRQATVSFLRRYPNHQHSHFIAARIKRMAKDIRELPKYNTFISEIFFDTLYRYPFIDLKRIEKNERLRAMKLWGGVVGKLCGMYFECRKLGFHHSALGLFSEINRIGGCFNSTTPDQEKYDYLIRTWDDMADADSVNFALLGKDQQPVHIITLEKKTDIERRLRCLAQNLRNLEAKGFISKFFPGTITVFSSNLRDAEFFNVYDVINNSKDP
ncbi:hypothetical protein ELAC_0208 [Estrella lausannensis]|uniref:Uncharacterized protein n=2 Tax=Estrella lausannensis TaxID=483423 RepID=A0A0H5DPZ2_9BACT|nr:hypothetical protein ELAC_0208 [Estrella lausannensis]